MERDRLESAASVQLKQQRKEDDSDTWHVWTQDTKKMKMLCSEDSHTWKGAWACKFRSHDKHTKWQLTVMVLGCMKARFVCCLGKDVRGLVGSPSFSLSERSACKKILCHHFDVPLLPTRTLMEHTTSGWDKWYFEWNIWPSVLKLLKPYR